MLSAKDIGGLMAMMPAFATDNAADIHATNTVDVAKLHKGVDRMIAGRRQRDGRRRQLRRIPHPLAG